MRVHSKLPMVIFLLSILVASPALTLGADESVLTSKLRLEGTLGPEDARGRAELFVPVTSGDSLLYADIRGMYGADPLTELNLGVGYRKLLADSGLILGAYGFYDRRWEYDYVFDQWTVGAELMSSSFTLRANAYIPREATHLATSAPADVVFIEGNDILYQEVDVNTYYQGMGGFDVEVGKRFGLGEYDLGLSLRAFRFTADNVEDLTGYSIRLDTELGSTGSSLWNLGFELQSDNQSGQQARATIGVQIPFGLGGVKKVSQEDSSLVKRMTEAARRDIDIVIHETTPIPEIRAVGPALDPDTGAAVENVWYVTANGDGVGTQDDPTNLI